MFWFGRPSYLRWVAAMLLVVGAAVIEFRPTGHAAYPFTAAPVEAGEALAVEWRMLPAGLYEIPVVAGRVAARPMPAGEPISRSDLQRPVPVPDGWWALAVEVPTVLSAGAALELVIGGGERVPGVVLRYEGAGSFDLSSPTALVAVPSEEASRVAAAVAARQAVVLVAPRDVPGAVAATG